MTTTVFYAWQSDLPNNTNRGFIEKALLKALDALNKDIRFDTVIDRNADGIPGIPDIPSTIYTKIAHADALVCDVSIVNRGSRFRRTPNPNILLELGYAMGVLGENSILMVLNAAFGDVGLLPFDLDRRRVLRYRADPFATDDERRTERDRLTAALEGALRAMLLTARETRLRDSRREIAWEINLNRESLRQLDGIVLEALQAGRQGGPLPLVSGLFLESVPLTLEWVTKAWTDATRRLNAALTNEEQNQVEGFYAHVGLIRQHIAHIAQAQQELRDTLRHDQSLPGGTRREQSFGSAAFGARRDFITLVHNSLAPQLRREIASTLALGNPLETQ